MKYFDTLGGAHAYAKNSSKKHEADRYVVKSFKGWYVIEDTDINEGETIIAHYKNGEQL